jgi:membrane-associated phospholipid phosphatase
MISFNSHAIICRFLTLVIQPTRLISASPFKRADFRNQQLTIKSGHLFFWVFFLASTFQQTNARAADNVSSSYSSTIGSTIAMDYRNFYSQDRLIRMGVAFSLGGIAANTNLDMYLRNWYQRHGASNEPNALPGNPETDDSLFAKTFGDVKYMVPIALLAASVNSISTNTALGNWGANASRAYIVGWPAVWGTQSITGGSRPNETPEGSAWRPFNDNNGVSGHAFMGAVPFMTIAAMNPDNAWVRYPAYLASAAAGWSRLNDDQHFTSQVVLGWYMAWEAVDAVMDTNRQKKRFTVAPMLGINGYGIIASASW